MKISTSFKVFVVILLVFSLISTTSVFYQLRNMDNDGRIVNYTGIVRGATQRLIKLELAGQQSDNLIATLDKIIKGLVEGDQELKLPVAKDQGFIAKMQEVETAWEALKQVIYQQRQNGNVSVLIKDSEAYFEITNSAVSAAEAFSSSKVNVLKIFQLTILGLNLVILSLIWLMSGKKISKPLIHLVNTINSLDISENIPEDFMARKDEIGLLSHAFQKVVDKLRELTKGISNISMEVAQFSQELNSTTNESAIAVEEIAKAIEELAKGASDQARDTEHGAAVATQLGDIIVEDLKDMDILMDKMKSLKLSKDEGMKLVQQLAIRNEDSNKAIKNIHEMIIKTNSSAERISTASNVINSIAEQTNLLALNAAIEAARAGEAGRGFSVVAEEIRKLAQQSTNSVKEIDEIVRGLQGDSMKAVTTMEKVVDIIKHQSSDVSETNHKYLSIDRAVEETVATINKSIASVNNMLSKKDELISIMESIAAVSQENAASTQEVSASVEEQTAAMAEIANSCDTLASLGDTMIESIAQFKS